MEPIIDFFNNQEYSSVFQGLSAIGTFITAIVTLITIGLIKKQIKNSHRPNMALSNKIFGTCKAVQGNKFRTVWLDDVTEDEVTHSTLALEVFNVGVGYAEQVELIEAFDLKKAIRFIKEHDVNSDFEISTDDSVLRIQSQFENSYIRIEMVEENRELGNFVTLANNGGKPDSYIFKDEYLAFLSCCSYLKEKNDRFLSLEKFPPLEISIKFRDIDGKKYKNHYLCKPFTIDASNHIFTFIKK